MLRKRARSTPKSHNWISARQSGVSSIESGLSRRSFLRTSGLAIGGLAGAAVLTTRRVVAQTTTEQPPAQTGVKRVKTICPFCAVGCGQKVYVSDELVVGIEGDPDSPISRGRCARRAPPASSWSTIPSVRPRSATGRRTRRSGRTSSSTLRST